MSRVPVSITALSSISPLGKSKDEVWKNYLKGQHFFEKKDFNGKREWIAPLSSYSKIEIDTLRKSDTYKNLDNSVLYALYASRAALKSSGWKAEDNFGVNIGSSRGATSLFEKHHTDFLENGNVSPISSPTTTLGNISSWVAHDLKTKGPEISHSITCSTALHALLNAMAWINSGMANKFLVGGSEAPLTPFTIAQMKALKIYSNSMAGESNQNVEGAGKNPSKLVEVSPCKALDFTKTKNSMILGEGAAVACLEKGVPPNSLAVIEGIGYATEPLLHHVSISSDAECFQKSMEMALEGIPKASIDVVVMHAPGTIKGDSSENKALEKVFGNRLPTLTTNKWKIGHTFGASGMLSIELALLMLEYQEFIQVPFVEYKTTPKRIQRIMVNAVGFGGNAVTVVLRKV